MEQKYKEFSCYLEVPLHFFYKDNKLMIEAWNENGTSLEFFGLENEENDELENRAREHVYTMLQSIKGRESSWEA